MKTLKDQISATKEELVLALRAAKDEGALESVRITFLGRNGTIAQLMDRLKKLPLDDKRTIGPLLNDLKLFAEQSYNDRKSSILHEYLCHEAQRKQHFDVTAYRHDDFRRKPSYLYTDHYPPRRYFYLDGVCDRRWARTRD